MLAEMSITALLIARGQSAPTPGDVEETGNSSFNKFTELSSGDSAAAKTIAGLSIALGLFIAFTGYRLFKAALAIAGFVAFSNLAYFILVRSEPSQGYGDSRLLILILVPVIAGFIGSAIAYKFYKIGLTIVGFLGGASLAILLLSLKQDGIIESDVGRIVFIVIMGIVGAILINFFEKPMIMSATAMLGSLTAFLGFDTFVQTGFYETTQLFLFGGLSAQDIRYTASSGVIGMIIGTIVLTIIAIGVQYKTCVGLKHK
jgi:Domain of unknown function (DUF4203)